MAVLVTELGRDVLTEMSNLCYVFSSILFDNDRLNSKLTDIYLKRKASAEQYMREAIERSDGGQELAAVRITVENPADSNIAYTQELERVVSEAFVVRAIDLYHWYLRRALERALASDRKLVRSWARVLRLDDSQAAAIEKASSGDESIMRLFRGKEGVIRVLVHRHLNVPDMSAIPVLVAVRNCIVHGRGADSEGKVRQLLSRCPDLDIQIVDNRVVISRNAADYALERIFSDMSIIDQAIGTVLGLPKGPAQVQAMSRTYVD